MVKMVDVTKIQASPSAIVLNEANISGGILTKERRLLSNANIWHKVIVSNSELLQRDFILKNIIDAVHPLDLIPVCFKSEGCNSYFLARNCASAIDKLARQNLIVQNPLNKDKPFKLTIILSFSNTTDLQINVQENITFVINKRYNAVTKTLNLDNFCKDPDLTEFCTLSQPKILYFVLHLSKHLQTQHLKLTNNEIRALSPLQSIWGCKNLASLDLRNNMISNMAELHSLNTLQLTELWLDGNPLCDNYDDYSYVLAVREVCTKIERLDGVLIGQNGFLAFRRNFVCNIDGQDLVNQFLEHYFTLYDARDRLVLEPLYHKDALFSLTAHYLTGQITSSGANLSQYKVISRNIKLMSDLSKSDQFLIRGNKDIVSSLSRLPPSEHDPYTFTVDLMYYTKTSAVLVVTGVFREPSESLLDSERLLGFIRTFVLLNIGNEEYKIVNEQLHVSNATTVQYQKAFKVVRVAKSPYVELQPAQNDKEKGEMIEVLNKITDMNLEWSRKCLEESHYDLKKALVLFVDLYKVDKIPNEAFRSADGDFQNSLIPDSVESLPNQFDLNTTKTVPVQKNVYLKMQKKNKKPKVNAKIGVSAPDKPIIKPLVKETQNEIPDFTQDFNLGSVNYTSFARNINLNLITKSRPDQAVQQPAPAGKRKRKRRRNKNLNKILDVSISDEDGRK